MSAGSQLRIGHLVTAEGAAVVSDAHLLQQGQAPVSGKDNLLIRRQRGKFIEGAELNRRGVAEGLRPKVKLTLLVGHETCCCKEARPEKEMK